jgi:predicted porin
MNNKIKLAVAGAVLSAASVANAGIIIPAGEWTIDINGNVNAFANFQDIDKNDYSNAGCVTCVNEDSNGEDRNQGIGTGLLPSWLGFTGTTRQNDLDVSFTISFQPGVSENSWHGDGSNATGKVNSSFLNRQTFVTFGDKSWGSVKLGKDLGIYAGNAILNDMTLLGVGAGGAGSGAAGNTTLGGIGTGYQYAAWKGQITYTTPNMNGFQAKVGIFNPNAFDQESIGATYQDRFGVEGQVEYSWTGDVAGKVWASGASYDITGGETFASASDADATISAWDIGAAVTYGNLGLVGYYYDGSGNGITALGLNGLEAVSGDYKKRDGDGGYVQATYVIPTGTKLGFSYGVSNLDRYSGESASATTIDSQERWTVGAYHPLTKHLNLVAEYSDVQNEGHNDLKNEYDTLSLGAILFF